MRQWWLCTDCKVLDRIKSVSTNGNIMAKEILDGNDIECFPLAVAMGNLPQYVAPRMASR